MQPDKFTTLVRQNKSLRSQLREANLTIHNLKQEIAQLQQRLAGYENEESTCNNIIPDHSSEEHFTDSSDQSLSEIHEPMYSSEKILPQEIPHESHFKSVVKHPRLRTDEAPSPRIIFNYESSENQVPKILMQKKMSLLQTTPIKDKMVHKLSDQQHSDIKMEEPILLRGSSSEIVQRIKTGKRIYETFFVTGYSFQKLAPCINFCYPTPSNHFPAILSLIYNQNPLRPNEATSASKSPRNSPKRGKLEIKQNFVIPLYSDHNHERSYLIVIEVEDYLEGPDAVVYGFSRMFCFITQCCFFSDLNKILTQFVDKINKIKSPLLNYSPLPPHPHQCQEFLSEQLSEHLRNLYEKNVQKNQFVKFGLGGQINIFLDILPEEREYEYLLQYQQWKVLSSVVYITNEEDYVGKYDHAELLGYLLTYLISETKILLFSASKSKVSEAILQVLEIIKPLDYVNPIIMGAVKDQYQEYLGAPMPVLLGLWGQAKRRKQKIQIFMNKKPNLQGMIEDGKLKTEEGVIFNLDTGYAFGSGLCSSKNKLAQNLNSLIAKQCRKPKEVYKLFRRIVEGNIMLQSPQLKQVSEQVFEHLQGTQLYTYYREKLVKLLPNV